MPGSGDPEGEPEDAPDTSVDAVDLGGEVSDWGDEPPDAARGASCSGGDGVSGAGAGASASAGGDCC